ncbi:CaiB/BaiF CoA-transferase family protein [uncultured Roseobacter sp.]|uniref:CaiB/BaiF CoA transferase family protein n=1 Tax=uncultured Roseobacter sp. TaxID=114847 RepID=UPI00260612B9|nr:CaiB/BaiF CoA-transferase family protein [uncultured Roseobacter sp.]
MSGPLTSLRVVEFTGLGPAPLAGQLLADMGAEVTVIDRASGEQDPTDINRRGKRSVALNLKSDAGRRAAQKIIAEADILIEGFRPGVMERLGLGPEDCPENLIYARMTGWGQTGPLAQRAGHDINYLALTGALHAIGPADRPPVVPLNLIADFGGGTMFLLFGILSAVIERTVSGRGQVVDAAMSDGVPAMMGLIHTMIARGTWSEQRSSNWLDGASPFYRCYECADGRYISVGALEPQFYAELVRIAGLDDKGDQMDVAAWPGRAAEFADTFRTRTRDEWADLFAGSDACVAPVLSFAEATLHPQNSDRAVFSAPGGVTQAACAPRFSRSTVRTPETPGAPGADTEAVLGALGYSRAAIAAMRAEGDIT